MYEDWHQLFHNHLVCSNTMDTNIPCTVDLCIIDAHIRYTRLTHMALFTFGNFDNGVEMW